MVDRSINPREFQFAWIERRSPSEVIPYFDNLCAKFNAEWREVFNDYDPPRMAVAEAWVHPSRRPRYASPQGLGQAFNFDLLQANWDAGEYLRTITDNLSDAQRQAAT